MRWLGRWGGVVLVLAWAGAAVAVDAPQPEPARKPMTFRLEPPTSMGKVALNDTSWDIFLDGDIEADTATRFKAEILKLNAAPGHVYINSPGGAVLAGLDLGEAIRKAKYTTEVGQWNAGPHHVVPGVCLSACTFAFLGGVYRYVLPDSRYGMHRVSTTAASLDNLDVGQIVTARISLFVHDMGADARLVTLYTSIPKEDVYVLSARELVDMKVVNNGRQPATWDIKMQKEGAYLRGVQQTVHGYGKAIFLCSKTGSVIFFSVTSASEIADAVTKGHYQHSLIVDDDFLPLPMPTSDTNENGYVNAMFRLTDAQVTRIIRAKDVGHGMQAARDAPTFIGYQVDIDTEAHTMVQGFLENCLAQQPAPAAKR